MSIQSGGAVDVRDCELIEMGDRTGLRVQSKGTYLISGEQLTLSIVQHILPHMHGQSFIVTTTLTGTGVAYFADDTERAARSLRIVE